MDQSLQDLELVQHYLRRALSGEEQPSVSGQDSAAFISAVMRMANPDDPVAFAKFGRYATTALLDHVTAGWRAERASRMAADGAGSSPLSESQPPLH
jgi:hypothetical protein